MTGIRDAVPSNRPHTRTIALGYAALLGVLAHQLLRSPGRPGLNVVLWAIAGTAAIALLSRHRDLPVSKESWWLVGSAAGFAGLLALRDADALAVFCLLAGLILLGLAAGRGALAWARQAHIVEVAVAAVRVGILIALGPIGWSLGAARQAPEHAAETKHVPRTARTLARGTLMALPALFILTALLMSADPIFERMIESAFVDGIEPVIEFIASVALVGWFTSGYLRAFMVNDDAIVDRVQIPRPALAPAEVSVSVSLLNVLFLAFLAVQVRYLFGGAGFVEVAEGLTYAEYARRGFFELIAAAALVVPVLLLADWAAAPDDARGRRMLRITSTVLVVLLGGVLASAGYRMRLYQDAYGLTEQRLYASVFMIWLMNVLGWLAVTVLRGRRRGFTLAATLGGLGCIVALHAMNPHALIARVNINRAASGAEVDAQYLGSLSADAVPTLLSRMPALPTAGQCEIARMLEERWKGEREGGWRTWNLGDARARRLVATFSPPGSCPAVVPVESNPPR